MSNSLELSRVVSIKSHTWPGTDVSIRTLTVTTDDDEVFRVQFFYEKGEEGNVAIRTEE